MSAISSNRCTARETSSGGPDTAHQPSFTCGRPHTLESPESANASTSSCAATVGNRSGSATSAKSANTSSQISAHPALAHRSASAARSACLRNAPVGFPGLTASTARARGGNCSAVASRCHSPSNRSGYGTA